MQEEAAAAAALEQLGLTEYEAKCFVALTRVDTGTAKEISQLSDIPRSRVYDTVDRLQERGLVDVQQSDPREFRAISTAEALETLRRDFGESAETAENALEAVESEETQEEVGTWSIESADHVTDRKVKLLEDAEHDVHLVLADSSVLAEETLDALAAATDRDVSVLVEVPTAQDQHRVQEAVPDARVVVAAGLRENYDVEETWPGELLLIDEHAVLASGLQESHLPDVDQETAVWTHGRDHGFAAWMRELLQDRARTIDESE